MGGLLLEYCAKLNDGKSRIMLQCNFLSERFTKFTAVFDTGAEHTCITARTIRPEISEEKLINLGCNIKTVVGLIHNDSACEVKYYQLKVKDFFLGNIHLTGADIWITFDDRVTDSVVGMDILSRVPYYYSPSDEKVHFFKNEEIARQELMTNILNKVKPVNSFI